MAPPPVARKTVCAWSQRRTRRWRARAWVLSGKLAGSRPAGRAGVKVMRRAASFTVMRRSSPLRWESSRKSSVISTQSPVLKRNTSSRPRLCSSSSVADTTLATPVATLALSRDHLKVAPAPGWPASWISTR